MIRKASFSSMFVWVALGLLLQAQTCERGDTYLLSLSFVVDGEEQIQGFNINNRTGYSVTTTGTTGTLTVETRMEDSTATYQWIVDGATIEAGQIGVGGGSVVLTIPDGQSQLYVAVRAFEGNVDGYWVDVERTDPPAPFPCTEQGILDAIAAGGGPHTFGCSGPTTVPLSGFINVPADVVLDGEGLLSLDLGEFTFLIVLSGTLELRAITVASLFPSSGLQVSDATIRLVDSTFAAEGLGGSGSLELVRTTALAAIDIRNGSLLIEDSLVQGGIVPSTQVVDARVERAEIVRSTILEGPDGNGVNVQDPSTLVSASLRVVDSLLVGRPGATNLAGVALSMNAGGGAEILNTTLISGDGLSSPGVALINQTPPLATSLVNTTVVGSFFLASEPVVSNSLLISADCSFMALLSSAGHNIQVGADTCGLDDPTDLVNVDPALLNLGPLQDNGGPTETFLPGPGSVSIDAIPPAACLDADGLPLTTDQRGISRPQGTACDIGAVEVEQP